MPVSWPLFSGFSKVSTVPAGRRAKAELTGAKTVKGPAPSKVGTSPAALTAATSVVCTLECAALSTMFLLAYIGAPPTIGLARAAPPTSSEATTRPRRRPADLMCKLDMNFLLCRIAGRLFPEASSDLHEELRAHFWPVSKSFWKKIFRTEIVKTKLFVRTAITCFSGPASAGSRPRRRGQSGLSGPTFRRRGEWQCRYCFGADRRGDT